MTVEPICFICGVEMPCIDGLCPDCHTEAFFSSLLPMPLVPRPELPPDPLAVDGWQLCSICQDVYTQNGAVCMFCERDAMKQAQRAARSENVVIVHETYLCPSCDWPMSSKKRCANCGSDGVE